MNINLYHYFCGQAIAGLSSFGGLTSVEIAEKSIEIADAMCEKLEKRKDFMIKPPPPPPRHPKGKKKKNQFYPGGGPCLHGF